MQKIEILRHHLGTGTGEIHADGGHLAAAAQGRTLHRSDPLPHSFLPVLTSSWYPFQNDIEDADMRLEMEHLTVDPEGELEELAHIYENRGLPKDLALQVAKHMHDRDPLEAHLRDELGQFEHTKARPLQAAIASAISFTVGGFVPFLGAFAPTLGAKAWSIVVITLFGLIGTGIISARTAGAPVLKTTTRIFIGGSIGMAITAGIGQLVHISGI